MEGHDTEKRRVYQCPVPVRLLHADQSLGFLEG